MKKQIIDFIDPDLIDYEENSLFDHTIIINADQSIELYLSNCLTIHGRLMYKVSRPDSIADAKAERKNGELIAVNNSACYILSPDHNKCINANQAVMVSEADIDRQERKEVIFHSIINR